MPQPDYLNINKATWNHRVESHLESEFYNLKGFLNGDNPLNALETQLLGNIQGKSLLHLQCHFGLDTLALAKLGAVITGIDFSEVAIEQANSLAKKTGLNANFVCCDVYDVPQAISEKFDIVFTSYGTIGWLPDAKPWAQVIADMLKPGGQFVMVDFHPTLWMMDNQFEKIEYSYFKSDPIVDTETGSYADKNGKTQYTTVGWNHSFGEILGSLLAVGLELKHFEEYDYAAYDCFNKLVKTGPREFQVEHLKGILPMMYSIIAKKKS
jgi:SAM-dependent methyltransferase